MTIQEHMNAISAYYVDALQKGDYKVLKSDKIECCGKESYMTDLKYKFGPNAISVIVRVEIPDNIANKMREEYKSDTLSILLSEKAAIEKKIEELQR